MWRRRSPASTHKRAISKNRHRRRGHRRPGLRELLAGRKVKVLLGDVDLIRWRQDLIEDRNRLATLLSAAASRSDASRDAKLNAARQRSRTSARTPINAGNRKVIVFTAFADTATTCTRTSRPGPRKPWARTAWSPGRSQPDHPAGLAQGSGQHPHRVLAALQGAPRGVGGEGELDLLIATDCISEGQNLQDCDWLVNYDIHWNPVRIIQRFGRIDRIGSPNASIQLVNFWPNMELDEYINLEQRVSGKMVLLDISATGEENLIEQQSGDPMNDLEYRRKQLLKLQDAVIDMEDLSSGVSITDLTLTDFRIDPSTKESKRSSGWPCSSRSLVACPSSAMKCANTWRSRSCTSPCASRRRKRVSSSWCIARCLIRCCYWSNADTRYPCRWLTSGMRSRKPARRFWTASR
jgi:hypothetical protein